jgi:hypothetical protein
MSNSNIDNISAKEIIQTINFWCSFSVDSIDKLTQQQTSELLYDIEQLKLSLHLFENLIINK